MNDECRVLVVDDESAILEGYQKLIEWENLNCRVVGMAMDGEEAVEKAKALSPDIIIMDINLPKLTGLEAIRKIRETENPRIPIYIIIVSGYDGFSYCQEALRLQVTDFLLKPLDFDEFSTLIRKLTRKIFLNPERGSRKAPTHEKIIEYMKNHLEDENMSLTLLAEKMHLNPAYISQVFKKETGEGYHAYLNMLRMERAKEYLIHTDEPVTRIASQVGFSDYRVFTRRFKSVEGITPSQYRKENTVL